MNVNPPINACKDQALRAPLASATSLLALLLLETRPAIANPIITAGTATPFYYALGTTWDAGIDSVGQISATDTYTFTALTTGAASTTDGYTGATPYFAVGQSALAKLATSSTRSGNSSGLYSTGSSAGPVGAGNSVFVGTSRNVSLLSNPANLLSGASASFGYTIAPTRRAIAGVGTSLPAGDNQTEADNPPATIQLGAPSPLLATAENRFDLVLSDALNPRIGNREQHQPDPNRVASKISRPNNELEHADNSSQPDDALGYTYNPLSRGPEQHQPDWNRPPRNTLVMTKLANVSPSQATTDASGNVAAEQAFSGSIPGASVFSTRVPDTNGPTTPASIKVASSALRPEMVKAFYRALQWTVANTHRDDTSLTELTVDGYKNAVDTSNFAISHSSDNIAPTIVPLPILVVASGGGELPSSLMIFTPGPTSSRASDDALSYFFNRGIMQ